MTGRILKRIAALSALAWATAVPVSASADDETFPPEAVAAGAKLFADNCAVCHGDRMVQEGGGGIFDLRTFPHDKRSRFVASVSNGKNSMPPWKSVLSADQIGTLWAYVVAGEKSGDKK